MPVTDQQVKRAFEAWQAAKIKLAEMQRLLEGAVRAFETGGPSPIPFVEDVRRARRQEAETLEVALRLTDERATDRLSRY